MIACYDLARCPPTFDVVAFLALLELERVRRGEDSIDLHVLPGPASGFRRDGLWPREVEERTHLRDNVLVPLCRLLPSVRSVVIDTDRSTEGWGKGEYNIGLPAIIVALREGSRPLRTREADYRHKSWITFTLREAAHHPLRNSRTKEWLQAASILTDRGLTVTIIRDTACANEPLPGYLVNIRAPVDIARRAVVYVEAALNVGISNGPMWMSMFMGAPTLMLRPTTNAAGGCYDDAFYAKCGLRQGDQLPTSPANQRLCWEEDTCDNIVRAVEEMLADV